MAKSRARFLLAGLLHLTLAALTVLGAIFVVRLIVRPLVENVFGLDEAATSLFRRVSIFAATVLSYWGFVRVYERRRATELAPRWRWIGLAGAAGSLSIGVVILTLYATGHYRLVSTRGFGQAAGVLGLILVAAVIEEITFRGILFRIVEERAGTRAALATSALIFGVMHLSNNGARPITLLSVRLCGLVWAGVFVVSRNLWVAAAHHACWNATIFLIGVPLSGSEEWRAKAPLETVTSGPNLWTGAAFGPEDSLLAIVLLAAICVGLWHLARRTGQIRGIAIASNPPQTR